MGIKIDFKQLEGKRYSNLVFIKALPPVNKHRRPIEVLCECGVTKIVDWDNLQSGKTKSCGCKQWVEKWEGSDHKLHKVWVGIKQRCYNPANKAYSSYGAIGVTMCDEWLHDYKAFYKWCIENGWKDGLEVDKDIKGGKVYSPQNCTIATRQQNMDATRGQIRVPLHIQKAVLESKLSCRQLGKVLDVSRTTISKIRKQLK